MVEEEKFYESSDESNEDSDEEDSDEEDSDEKQRKKKKKPKKKPYSMDPDHRLLLRVSKPLLQSRNAAVSLCQPASQPLCALEGEFTLDSESDFFLCLIT